MVRGDAVGKTVWAAGVFGDVSADGAGALAGRVGRVVEPVLCGRLGEFDIDDAGLHQRCAVAGIDLDDAVQAGESDYHRVPEGNRAAGKAGPRAARHDVGPVPVGDPDGGPDFLRRPGHYDRARHGLVNRAVILVDEQVFRPPDHVLRADGVF